MKDVYECCFACFETLPDIKNFQTFDRTHFKCWQGKVYDTLNTLNLAEYLTQKQLDNDTRKYEEVLED